MYYLAPFDPFAPGAYRVQDVFSEEVFLQDSTQFALFDGEDRTTGERRLLLVAPSIAHVPATEGMAEWEEASELPYSTWRLLSGPADAWTRFGLPEPS